MLDMHAACDMYFEVLFKIGLFAGFLLYLVAFEDQPSLYYVTECALEFPAYYDNVSGISLAKVHKYNNPPYECGAQLYLTEDYIGLSDICSAIRIHPSVYGCLHPFHSLNNFREGGIIESTLNVQEGTKYHLPVPESILYFYD